MERLLFSLGCVLFATSLFAAEAGPRIACKMNSYDFGSVNCTNQIKYSFLLENKGDAPLVIDKIRACCGGEAKFKDNQIEPGKTTSVDINLSLQAREGKVQKSFFVVSNDPSEPYFQLMMTGMVLADCDLRAMPVSVTPSGVEFGQIKPDVVVEKVVELRAISNITFHLTGIVCTSASFRAESKVLKNGLSYALTIRTVPPMQKGQQSTQVSIVTDNKNIPRIDIPVQASVFSDFVVVPREIVLKMDNKKLVPITRYFAVRSRSGAFFNVLKIDVPEPGIQVTTEPIGTDGFKCALKNLMPFAELNGRNIVITTDNKDSPRVVIPIRVEL